MEHVPENITVCGVVERAVNMMSNLEYASKKGAEAIESILSGKRVDIIIAGMIEICMEYLAEILDELKSMRMGTGDGPR